MGGCASKPKEFIKSADPPIKSKKPQPETSAQDNTDAGENKTEKPSVEVSDSKEEAQPSSFDEPSETVGGGGEPVSSKDGDDKAASKNNNDTIEPVKKAEVDPESSSEEAKRNEPIKEE